MWSLREMPVVFERFVTLAARKNKVTLQAAKARTNYKK